MKRYWWILDEWDLLNVFDSPEVFNHARKHVHGCMECDTFTVGAFNAENVEDCWTMEEVMLWEDGIKKEIDKDT